MKLRKWLTSAALTAGLSLGVMFPAVGAEKKSEFTFGAMRTASVETARNQAFEWLKSTGKMDESAFQKLWAQEELSVFERTIQTLLLGSDEAKKLLSEAKAADKSAPKEVPAFFKKETNAFLKSNLALAYAKALSTNRVYEEALDTLKQVSPEQVQDPSAYFFHRAVAEHALMKKDEATKTIIRLLDDVSDSPDRYKMVATIMFIDMQGWKKDEKDLGNIAKLMDNVERRLELSRGGQQTQEIQKKIVFRLDELIKEKENQANSQCKNCNGGNCPGCGKPGNGQNPGANLQPSSPMDDSRPGGGSGQGRVDEKKLRELEKVWGTLPEHDRAKAMSEITRDLPPKFRVVIEEYFKSLSKATP